MHEDADARLLADRDKPGLAMADVTNFTLSIDDAIERYKAAGIPRIRRTVQRYCANNTLDAHKFAVPYGEQYLITPESVTRHIAYILEGRSVMANQGQPRPTTADDKITIPQNDDSSADEGDQLRVADFPGGPQPVRAPEMETIVSAPGEIVHMLRTENQFLKGQIAVKDAQLAVKDRQITDQSERVRETNLLVASLHKLITPLLGGRDPSRSAHHTATSGLVEDDIHNAST